MEKWEELADKFFPKQTEEEKRKILTPQLAKKIIKAFKPFIKVTKKN